MADLQLGLFERQFAEFIWEREPVSSTELARIALEKFSWKKSTTYTVLRRLCDKGLFQNENGIVTSLISKDAFSSIRSEQFVNDDFEGSLPAFLTAFTRRKKLSKEEIEELEELIEKMKEL